jgi:ABC-type lipoprotein release transport system permease subunit
LIVGLLAAALLTGVLESLLFGIDSVDPATLAIVSALMLGVAVLAAYSPARRASVVDPVRALRE